MSAIVYIQGELTDIWKENIIKNLESSFCQIQEFGGGDDKTIKIAELKKIEQGEKIIEEFVQELRRVAKESGYERRLLVKEFKQGMNRVIRWKLMKSECSL